MRIHYSSTWSANLSTSRHVSLKTQFTRRQIFGLGCYDYLSNDASTAYDQQSAALVGLARVRLEFLVANYIAILHTCVLTRATDVEADLTIIGWHHYSV